MKLAFNIALRFLNSNKGQTFLIILGIAIGVSVQVFIGSLIQGLQKDLINTTIGNAPQITVLSALEDKTIGQWEGKINTIKNSKEKITALSPTASFPGFIAFNKQTEPVLLRGFDLSKADSIYGITQSIYEGMPPTRKNDVLIGKELRDTLSLNIGDTITILTPTRKSQTMTITGFYDIKVASINQSWVITPIHTVQSLFEINNKITGIEIQVAEVFEADTIASHIDLLLGQNDLLKISNWKDQNQQLLSGLQGQSVSSIMIQVFVLIAVILGIASVLAISVLQKSRQIGILKAMGVKDFTASLIFLFQGFLLGIMGSILGIALGLLLAFSFTLFAINPDGTPVVALYINYGFVAISAIIAILSSTLAALIPAIKSSKLSPMEVIKNG